MKYFPILFFKMYHIYYWLFFIITFCSPANLFSPRLEREIVASLNHNPHRFGAGVTGSLFWRIITHPALVCLFLPQAATLHDTSTTRRRLLRHTLRCWDVKEWHRQWENFGNTKSRWMLLIFFFFFNVFLKFCFCFQATRTNQRKPQPDLPDYYTQLGARSPKAAVFLP